MHGPFHVRIPSYPIAAYSAVNALGTSRSAVFDGALRGVTALRAQPGFPTFYGTMPAALPALPAAFRRFESRVAQIAWLAIAPLAEAIAQSIRRFGADRVAVVVGSSNGGILETEAAFARHARGEPLPADYFLDHRHSFDALTELISEATGASGPRFVVSAACASSAKALGSAQRLMAAGFADAVLVVGADSECQTTLRGFAGLRILSTGPCRPFDLRRDGISLGEGAASLLLERDGVAPVHLLSVGESSDAHHVTAPHPEGVGAIAAMEGALAIAGLTAADIGYVNAHGTGTVLNDNVESDALLTLFGSDVPVSSSKGLVGHLLGAAGATEAVLSVDALVRGVLPANVGSVERDPHVRVEILDRSREIRVRHAISNSFGFGGANASVVLGAPVAGAVDAAGAGSIHVMGLGFWARNMPDLRAWLSGREEGGVTEPAAEILTTRARGRASLLTRMLIDTVTQAFSGDRASLSATPLVFASAYGEMETTLDLLAELQQAGSVLSPLRFQASIHSAAAGVFSVQTGNRSFSTSLAAGPRTAAAALLEAVAWLRVHGGEIGVAIADEDSPASLLPARRFPPVATAFRLQRAVEPPSGSLGRLELSFATHAQAVADAPLADNPSAGALPLLRAAALARFGTVGIGPGLSVKLYPPESEP